MTYKKQSFTKHSRMAFNSSYYRRQIQHENTKHYQIKKWIGNILKTYYFDVNYEFTDPNLLAPRQVLTERQDPYILDIIAHNTERHEFITAEINGPYHYKHNKIVKDNLKLNHIIEWIPTYISRIIQQTSDFVKVRSKTYVDGENAITVTIFRIADTLKEIIHKHVAVSRNDIYKGFLDYEGLLALMGL